MKQMGVPVAKLRFPNPGSDIDRMAHVFALVAIASEGTDPFGLDFMTEVVISEGQASSQGAQGAMALARSRRDDRSRDPLYNQLKMYSEIYRMLGWMRPTPESRLTFETTLLGEALAFDTEGNRRLRFGIIRESLIALTYPNMTTENIGVKSQRPFVWLLQLAANLGGLITRHEMILGLLAQVDDQKPRALANAVTQIEELRQQPVSAAIESAADFAAKEGVQLNSLENYTRFPVGVLSSAPIGWGAPISTRDLYRGSKAVKAIQLTQRGIETAGQMEQKVFVRSEDLGLFSLEERADLASLAYYVILKRAGFADPIVDEELTRYSQQASVSLTRLGVSNPMELIFSPFTQETDEVLSLAQERYDS